MAIENLASNNQINLNDYKIEIPEELEDLIPNFIERRKNELKILDEYHSLGDFDKIAIVGHRLKGNGTSYGFIALSKIGENLEKAAKQSDASKVEATIENYQIVFKQLTENFLEKDCQ